MCGIAGIIYRDDVAEHDVGRDMTQMLQSMKHRGPDSTGYALYRPPSVDVIMRYTIADANDPRDFEFEQRLARNRAEVERRLRLAGAEIDDVQADTEYAYRVKLRYDGDLKRIADILGHRSIDTTAVYAKVDVERLTTVALPWPTAWEVHP